MTPHSNIKEKFMIEYDKANVTSSYPSYTNYEIATILNKAYLALIAQKVTGNNTRRAPFEADTKAISDIQELVKTVSQATTGTGDAANSKEYSLPSDFLYYISGVVKLSEQDATVELVSHEIAQRFKQTRVNRPWIKNAVAYIEDDKIIMLYDNYNTVTPGNFSITYIKEPAKFTAEFNGQFELNDTMVEELISLAVLFALENVESTRLNTKAQTRGLEA